MTFSASLIKRANLLLVAILFLSASIRFTALSSLPVSLYWDEVSEGYNAYSILHTNKDEWGNTFPIVFRAFDDDKMPVNVYLSTIPIAVFGLNEFSVRFTSALAGTLSVLFIYLVTREIMGDKNNRSKTLGLIAAFLLAVTPWEIIFSRTGFEANVAISFTLLGTYLFLLGLRRNLFLYFAIVIYIVNFYTYRSSVVFIPLLLCSFLLLFRKKLFVKEKRFHIITCLVIFVLSVLPLVTYWSSHGDVRSQQVSIFSDDNPHLMETIKLQEKAGNSLFARIIYNRRLVYAEQALGNYISYYSINFLFISGDGNPRHSVTGQGLLYLWELPLIVLGAYYVYKKNRQVFFFLIVWLLFAPVAASLSLPSPHALRALAMVTPLTILCSAGIMLLIDFAAGKRRKEWLVIAIFVCIALVSFFQFLPRYVYHNTVTAAADWGDGYKQLLVRIESMKKNYDKIIISGHYWQPYAYTLFYEKYDPTLYQKYGSQTHFANYIFGGTSWDQRLHRSELDQVDLVKLAGTHNALVALSPQEYKSQSANLVRLEDIRDHSGRLVFILSRLN